jgi:hypothetical protein
MTTTIVWGSVYAETAEAVKDSLIVASDAGEFYTQITPVRSYADWTDELRNLDELHVDIVANQAGDQELTTRGMVMYELPIDIGVRQRFDKDGIDHETGRVAIQEVDRLVLLVEEIARFLAADRLTTYSVAAYVETRVLSLFNRRHLRELNQFTGLIRSVYQVEKAV